MSRDWNEFRRWEKTDCEYLPVSGEGKSMATQITTAVTKLVYKWYNDGDVFDNTQYLKGWCNDLSSYANWLYRYCPEAAEVISKWWYDLGIHNEDEYEDFLYELCEACQDLEVLETTYADKEKVGNIYKCEGPFKFEDPEEEEEW